MFPRVTHASLGQAESTTQTASRSVLQFLYSSLLSVVGHARAFPPYKLITPSHRGPLWFQLGPPESSAQTASQSVKQFLQGSITAVHTDTRTPTDHTNRSTTIGSTYVVIGEAIMRVHLVYLMIHTYYI